MPSIRRPKGRAPLWGELPEGPRVALVPTNRRANKRWPASAFAEAARLLHYGTGAVFAVVGGSRERDSAEEVAAGLVGVPHRVHIPSTLGEYVRFLAGADLYLGNDTGPRHLAMALGIPTLAYFWTENPTYWTLPGSDRHQVIWDPRRAGGLPVRADLKIIEERPDVVALAAAELLRPVTGRPESETRGVGTHDLMTV